MNRGNASFCKVLVIGGGGYVGAALVPRLLAEGFPVRVLDLFIYGRHVLDSVRDHPELEIVQADLRDQNALKTALDGCDAVIHLACISNDPSFDLDPDLGRSINYDAFEPLVALSRERGVRRFVFASTSSVYGVSEADEVTEDHPLSPLTDYSRYKGLCETILLERGTTDFVPVILRPATVCGYSPRQRFDVIVNILTNHAVNLGRIKVTGGAQKRPNIHIEDMVDAYLLMLRAEERLIAGKTYNVGTANHTVSNLATLVQGEVMRLMDDRTVEIITLPTDDPRSYHICSERIRSELNFVASRTIESAVADLVAAMKNGKLPNPLDDHRYYNVKMMRDIALV